MSRLLRANLSRLRKTKAFWICTALAAAFGAGNILLAYSTRPISVEYMGSYLLSNGTGAILFTAIFAALYLGTDHSNGTIRNKLIVGRTRVEIYFANLITICFAGILQYAAACVSAGAVGLLLGGKLGMSSGEFALGITVILCAVTALCALFTVIGMLLGSKSAIVIVTLISVIALMMSCYSIVLRLAEQETVTDAYIDENGVLYIGGEIANPAYVGGVQRSILIAVNDVLPSGQLIQMTAGEAHNAELMPLYSLGVLAVSTAAGAIVFRKKDLK